MPTSSPATLVLERVTRRLAGRSVVQGLSLSVRQGEVLGLLGVNGAGKTTALRMMAGVLAPNAGAVQLLGHDLYQQPERARRQVGYLPEIPPLHQELCAEEFLTFCARLHGVARGRVASAVARALERCGLGAVRRRPMATLSKGFRQRVGLAQAIVHEPELIVLDEPASGLDPVQALNLRELVRSLGAGHAVVLSTHTLPDVVACCDRVAIMHGGQLRHVGALGVADSGALLRVAVSKPMRQEDWLTLRPVASVESIDARRWRVRLQPGTAPGELARSLVESGFGLQELRAESNALETTFLAIAAADVVPDAA